MTILLKGNQGGPIRPPGLHVPTARHPLVPTRQVRLSEKLRVMQILKGLFVEVDGEKYALPIDSWNDRSVFLGQRMWAQGRYLPHRAGARAKPPGTDFHRRALAWLRDNVHEDIPPLYYQAVLGHDLHVSTWGDLYARHWHAGWASPFDPGDGRSLRAPLDPWFTTLFATHWQNEGEVRERMVWYCEHGKACRLGDGCPSRGNVSGRDQEKLLRQLQGLRGFVENLGWLSGGKVTTAFVSEEIDELVSTTGTEYADFDHHEVGTSSAAESNAHTALTTSTGIARAAGTPTDSDPIYQSVGTITADSTETWAEHGLFNNAAGVAMMDRSLTGGQAVVLNDQVQYTYQLTKNAEA